MGSYFSADQLLHFVGRNHPTDDERCFDVLTRILKSQVVSHPPHEVRWTGVSFTIRETDGSLLTQDLVVPEVICFCDIPLEHIDIHVRKYGRFGLALPKKRLAQYGARPVIYAPMLDDDALSPYGRTKLRDIEAIYRSFRSRIISHCEGPFRRTLGTAPTTVRDIARAVDSTLTDYLAFIKPFNAELAADNPDYFYAEREWRHPGNHRFDSSHVLAVIVASGSFRDRVAKEFPEYAGRILELA